MDLRHDYGCDKNEKDICTCGADDVYHQKARIAELEAERDKWRNECLAANESERKLFQRQAELERELAEERALSADLARAVALYCPWVHSSLKNYMEKYPDWENPLTPRHTIA